MNFELLKEQAEALIRAGKREQARSLLLKLKGEPVPRARASELAQICRRANLLPLALQIMSPIVRPKIALDKAATDSEKATYALILLGFGASKEALELLESAQAAHPDVCLSLAFTHINRWDYLSAAGFLQKYLRLDSIAPYKRTVAKVNLAAAYVVTGNIAAGKPLLEEILHSTVENHWNLLHKNALELGAQVAVQEKDWFLALKLLEKASVQVEGAFNLDDFFIRKWQSIVAVLRDGGPALGGLEKIRSEAIENCHYETVRDCDFHRAMALHDPALMLQVYFGTPYAGFRKRLVESAGSWLKIPKFHIRQMGGTDSSRVFDLRIGEEEGGGASVRAGQALHRAMQILASDFYRPFAVGALHSSLFAGEFYNLISSPRRVSFLIHRLREWMTANEIPLKITVDKEGYRLAPMGTFAFKIWAVEPELDVNDPKHYLVMLDKLRRHWPGKLFSSAQTASHLGISLRAARYLVKWALEKKKLKKVGTGRATQYRVGR